MIKLKNVEKKYFARNYELDALKNINLEILKSEFLAIVGKSGSGKSTLIKIIGMLDSEFQGSYEFDNIFIQDQNDNNITVMRRNIGFIFQDFQLINRYSIYKNVELAYVIKYKQTNKQKILKVLCDVGLSDRITSYPDELSGGQKQRVSIARALVTNPNVIIADEPTGALDEKTSTEIMDLLLGINKLGTTIILVTHDNDIAQKASRIVRIVDGEIE